MLAFACAFTMFAGAAFTDETDINADNRDAVELLTALNIIQGYEDGSFDPEGTVDRAEMAKMIYVIRNGGNDDASAYETVTTSFTDISGHWAEGYIKYLQNTGIVAGKSATKFDPDSQVTTGEAMKMALALAGYDEDHAGLTGINWLNNTVSQATTVGMTDDVHSAIAGGCTRQDAAQILSNTLVNTGAVRWSAVVEGFVPDSNRGLAYGGEWISVGEKWMDLSVETGFITKAPNAKVNPKSITFVWDNDDDGTYGEDGATVTFRNSTLDVSDLLGYEVKAVWNNDDVTAADAVYGFYKTSDNVSYEATWKDIERDGDKVKFDDESYELDVADDRHPNDSDDTGIVVYADGAVVADNWNVASFNEDALADTVVFIDNDGDGEIEAAQIKTQDVTQITYVGANNIDTKDLLATGRIAANEYDPFNNYENAPDLDDVITYDGIAKDDYAKVSYDYYNDKVVYEKIDAAEATVEATRTTNAGTKEIRIDGTWYKPAAGYNTMPSIVSGDTISYIAIDTLLYNVEKIDGTWGSRSLAVVYDVAAYGVGARADELEVSLITRDGDKIVGLLDEYDGNAVTYIDAADPADAGYDNDEDDAVEWADDVAAKAELANRLMTYRQNGNDIELMPVSQAQKAGYDEVYTDITDYTADDKLTSTRSGDVAISDTAVVFVTDGSDADVLTGDEAKKAFDGTARNPVGQGDVATGGEENGADYIQACVLTVDDVDDIDVTGSNYAYVISAAETRNSDFAREFVLWTEDGLLTAFEEVDSMYEYEGGEIITYDITSTADGTTIIDNIERQTVQLGRVNSNGLVGSDSIAIDTTPFDGNNSGTSFDLDSDCEIINVDTEKDEGIEGDATSAIRYGQTGKANVAYITNTEGDIVFILVDGANEEISVPNANVVVPADTSAAALQEVLERADVAGVTINGRYVFGADMLVPAGKTLTVNGNVNLRRRTLTIDGQMTVNGNFNLNGGTLTGDGNLYADNMTWGSTISGSLRITTGSVTLAGDMTIAENANVVVNGDITDGATYTLTISGGKVTAQDVTGNLTVSGTASVDVADVIGDVIVSGSADVVMGAVDGDVTNTGDGTVTADSVSGQQSGVTTAPVEDLATILEKALDYEYDDEYGYTGTFAVSDGNVTCETTMAAFTEKIPGATGEITKMTADIARFLGALYRFDNGQSVGEITFNETNYSWDPASAGDLQGSNWYSNGTLVSAIGTWFDAQLEEGAFSNGEGTMTFSVDGEEFTVTVTVTDYQASQAAVEA